MEASVVFYSNPVPSTDDLGASAVFYSNLAPSDDDLLYRILDMFNYLRLRVLCMGLMAGGCILTLFAMKYNERLPSLVLVSTLLEIPVWT